MPLAAVPPTVVRLAHEWEMQPVRQTSGSLAHEWMMAVVCLAEVYSHDVWVAVFCCELQWYFVELSFKELLSIYAHW